MSIETIKALGVKFEESRKALVEEAKASLGAALVDVAKKYPNIGGAVWAQYTPYFNDGEPCEFGVHEVCVFKDEDDYSPYDDTGYDPRNSVYKKIDGEWTEVPREMSEEDKEASLFKKEIQELVSSLPEEILQSVFGDHVVVIVTKDEVKVDEWSHD